MAVSLLAVNVSNITSPTSAFLTFGLFLKNELTVSSSASFAPLVSAPTVPQPAKFPFNTFYQEELYTVPCCKGLLQGPENNSTLSPTR